LRLDPKLVQKIDKLEEQQRRFEADRAQHLSEISYLRARLEESLQRERDVQNRIMDRMGISERTKSEKSPEPIQLRRKPWDETRAELERESKEKHDHWVKKIEEVEKADREREQKEG